MIMTTPSNVSRHVRLIMMVLPREVPQSKWILYHAMSAQNGSALLLMWHLWLTYPWMQLPMVIGHYCNQAYRLVCWSCSHFYWTYCFICRPALPVTVPVTTMSSTNWSTVSTTHPIVPALPATQVKPSSNWGNSTVTDKCVTIWDSFESSVHCNLNLSSVDKCCYLNSLLESTAAEAIADWPWLLPIMRRLCPHWRRGLVTPNR